MIRVDSIRIEEFRGIRDLTLDFKRENFAVCGPNGTGKSGVVDALEFAITGNISRLAGEGTEGISIKEHAPHVDSRNAPDKARVTVTATIPKLSKTVTIVRTVKNPKVPTITPNDPAAIAILRELESHPEFVLTRREIIRYVLSPAGKRSKEVQALLRLDRVEEARAAFQKLSNASQKNVKATEDAKGQASEQLIRALGIPQLLSAELLKAVNTRRALLGLDPLPNLTPTTSLKDGLLAPATKAATPRIAKTQAVADVSDLRKTFTISSTPEATEQRSTTMKLLSDLAMNPEWRSGETREKFLRTGIDLVSAECPFCDTAWDPQKLRVHIQAKLARFDEVARQRTEAERQIQPLMTALLSHLKQIDTVIGYGGSITPPLDYEPLRNYRITIEAAHRQLKSLTPLSDSIAILTTFVAPSLAVLNVVAHIEQFISNLPEPTQQDSARDYLVAGQERLEAYREASRNVEKAKAQAQLTRQIADTYNQVSTQVLEGIFKLVEKEFGELYGLINRDDEAAFTARLTPSVGQLGFEVDFYGRGYFPPGAYHSEGHQDSMGLCLYLALMNHLLKDSFTFAVLDDVLMSVDTSHRREVCSLLKARFPKTQFILTTHDKVWLSHMRTVGLIRSKSAAHFRTWTVDNGPTEWDDKDVWAEMDDKLKKNDVRGAAGILRNHLEYIAAELCHKLRAPVEFRNDAQMQLGELLPPAIGRLKHYYKLGKEAAHSWGKADVVTALNAQEKTFTAAITASNTEQWQINPAIHYNEWANFEKQDFAPVVAAFKTLIECFRCQTCQSLFHVTPDRNQKPELLHCECNSFSINFTKNPEKTKEVQPTSS